MDDDERREALELILAEVERLRVLASASRDPAIASWLEGARAEARVELGKTDPPQPGATLDDIPVETPRMQAAKRHLADAERRVARQRQVVEKLSRNGHGTRMAEAILATFGDILLVRRADLLRLQAEALGTRPWKPIATVPFNIPVEVAIIGPFGMHVMAFACRRVIGGWLSVETSEQLEIDATHWRLRPEPPK